MPKVCCIVKEEAWHYFFTQSLVKYAGYFTDGNSKKMIEETTAYIKSGGNLIIFPEAAATQQESDYIFKRAAATIALQTNSI